MKHPTAVLPLLLLSLLALPACETTTVASPDMDALQAKGTGGGPPTGDETCDIHTDVTTDAGTPDDTTDDATLSGLCALVDDNRAGFTASKDVGASILKLNETSDKVGQGKTADAVQKLEDFIVKIGALRDASKPKIDLALADRLIAQAEALITELQTAL